MGFENFEGTEMKKRPEEAEPLLSDDVFDQLLNDPDTKDVMAEVEKIHQIETAENTVQRINAETRSREEKEAKEEA